MEAKSKKMQEMSTNDLQELNNKQTEIKNTPEGVSLRITEAEQINDLEDRMVEITATKQYRKKDEMKTAKRPLEQH